MSTSPRHAPVYATRPTGAKHSISRPMWSLHWFYFLCHIQLYFLVGVMWGWAWWRGLLWIWGEYNDNTAKGIILYGWELSCVLTCTVRMCVALYVYGRNLRGLIHFLSYISNNLLLLRQRFCTLRTPSMHLWFKLQARNT